MSTVVAGIAACITACVAGAPPEIEAVADQVAEVGSELRIELHASDPDGDPVALAFTSDQADLASQASLARVPGGTGIFRWTPRASDVGVWRIDFAASDGDHQTILTVRVDVRAAVGDRSVPRFRAPLGAGTTLDLARQSCVDLEVAIDDQDSASVTLTEEEPRIPGATLEATGGLTGRWHWCPTPEQIAADDRYTLTLAASDLTSPPVHKSYLVVLRRPTPVGCSGQAPAVVHVPADVTTAVGLTVDARITDDRGLAREPLLYHATTAPAEPVDLAAMSPVPMLLVDGTMRDGTWAADVPNPAAAGGAATLYYAIVASDDDDASGACDHTTQAPARGTYAMRVTRPGNAPEPCRDDAYEDNDSAADASPPLTVGAHQATSCPLATDPDPISPDDDEDWYALAVATDTIVSVEIAGSDTTDLDLALVDGHGLTLAAGTSATSVERVTACVNAGTYHVRVHAYGRGRNDYRLTVARAPGLCLRGPGEAR